jgi:exosortase
MQLSILPMLAGFVLALLGWRHLIILWFPLAFLIFMIPIPPSMTQSVALEIKLLATEGAVRLSQLFGLPMIRDGSYIHFKDDMLLVGEVCGGLRSLIALLAVGAIMAYISKTRDWARVLILVLSGPVAVIANVSRIFLLCVVGYFYGSEAAAGTVHDVSGILIFVVAFALLGALEALLRKVAPAREEEPSEG